MIALQHPALYAGSNQDCQTRLDSITVQGAETTREEALIRWSGLKTGQTVTTKFLKQARQKILDKDLFKEVTFKHDDLCSESISLTIKIEEKLFHLIYPRIYRNGDGDVSIGIRYRGSNLFGADQSLSLLYTQKEEASGETEDKLGFSYRIPLFADTYLARIGASTSETLVNDSTPSVKEIKRKYELQVGREWKSNPFDKPVTALADIIFEDLKLEGNTSQISTLPGSYNRLGITLEFDDVHYQKYRRFGRYFSLQLTRGLSLLGSDFSATQFKAEARRYVPVNNLDNLNARLVVKLSSNKIFNELNYSIGGSSTVRGIEEDSYLGNALWLANLEYVHGYSRWPSFRTAIFTHIGNIFEDHTTFNSHNWKDTYGLGLRWKLTSFVKTDLVIDYAFDPDTDFYKVYGSTSLMF